MFFSILKSRNMLWFLQLSPGLPSQLLQNFAPQHCTEYDFLQVLSGPHFMPLTLLCLQHFLTVTFLILFGGSTAAAHNQSGCNAFTYDDFSNLLWVSSFHNETVQLSRDFKSNGKKNKDSIDIQRKLIHNSVLGVKCRVHGEPGNGFASTSPQVLLQFEQTCWSSYWYKSLSILQRLPYFVLS